MDAEQINLDPGCRGCAEREQRIVRLEAQVQQLQQQIDALSRSSKRQAAPFSRGLPKADPRKPGRKAGEDYGTKAYRTIPPVIDEVHEASLPDRCPRCGGSTFTDQSIAHQYQVELLRRPVYRQFNVAVARCACCQGRVQGHHPLQTSDALGCCASQVGANAQAADSSGTEQELGLSQGKIAKFFTRVFDIKLTRSGSCQIMLRASRRCESTYQAIVKRVQTSPWLVPDETGWRIGGVSAWLHTAVGQDAVAYLIDKARGFGASSKLIGEDYAGVLVHDGYASYDQFHEATHQTCLAHLLRRCRELLESAVGGAVVFPRRIKTLLKEALALRKERDEGRMSSREVRTKTQALDGRMERLLKPLKTHKANERFARHLWRHRIQLFTFLRKEGIDATNWRAEQAIRPAVVNRKVWGGNRTNTGAEAQAILMSVWFTALKQGRDALAWLGDLLRALPDQRPLLIAQTS